MSRYDAFALELQDCLTYEGWLEVVLSLSDSQLAACEESLEAQQS